jgi:predicted secreted Zn-dependent protease
MTTKPILTKRTEKDKVHIRANVTSMTGDTMSTTRIRGSLFDSIQTETTTTRIITTLAIPMENMQGKSNLANGILIRPHKATMLGTR